MPTIRPTVINALAAGTVVPLGAFNRAGGRGGAIAFKATVPLATPALVFVSLQIGSDIIVDRAVVPVETALGLGPDLNSPVIGQGVGAPGDPYLITLFGDGAVDTTLQIEITNV